MTQIEELKRTIKKWEGSTIEMNADLNGYSDILEEVEATDNWYSIHAIVHFQGNVVTTGDDYNEPKETNLEITESDGEISEVLGFEEREITLSKEERKELLALIIQKVKIIIL